MSRQTFPVEALATYFSRQADDELSVDGKRQKAVAIDTAGVDMAKNKLGHFLREKREQKGLTQAQVANKLGYGSPQFISNIERGISRVPLKSLRYFIEVYDLRPDDVIDLLLEEKRVQLKKQLGLNGDSDSGSPSEPLA